MTLEEAGEIVQSTIGEHGAIIVGCAEYEKCWVFATEYTACPGEIIVGKSTPVIYKNSGRLAYLTPLDDSKGAFLRFIPWPGREKYREPFNKYSMERFGVPYCFPDEEIELDDPKFAPWIEDTDDGIICNTKNIPPDILNDLKRINQKAMALDRLYDVGNNTFICKPFIRFI